MIAAALAERPTLSDAIRARCEGAEPTHSSLRSDAGGSDEANREIADLEALREPAMHRNSDEACTTECDERANAMRDGVTRKRDFRIALTVEQTAATFANSIERSRCNVGRRDGEERSLCARHTNIDTTAATRCVRDAKLGHFSAHQCEHCMRVVTGVFVNREDLERQSEAAQVLRSSLHCNADELFVIAKRQDHRDVQPGAVGHRQRT
jgi:hypothetical protein